MNKSLQFRRATEKDCSDLTILCDSATRCLTSHMWAKDALTGQSSFEVGRAKILTDKEDYIYFENWRVAQFDQLVVGGFNTYRLPRSNGQAADIPDVLRPLNELKAIAEGTRYISAIAIFPEFRRNNFATQLLEDAERVASEHLDSKLTLMVGSFNTGALSLYRQFGFREWERKEFMPFENSDKFGEWVLMCKEVTAV